ncbi:MAG: ABC transporter permease [Alicyclobacillus sp.]|nr:ABC transporter permease [Alicyclobacillus sp.]
MLWSLILSELRTRYKGSFLGFLWTFVNPLLSLLVYAAVFSSVMRVTMSNYPIFIFIGLLIWNLFSTGVQSSAGVIIRQSSLVKKIYFPREILPLSVVGGSIINFVFSLLILIPFLLAYGYWPSYLWFLLPLVVLVEALFTTGLSMICAGLNVFFRDLEHMLGIFMMLLFYLTPVVYPEGMIPKHYLGLFKLNPVGDLVVACQSILYYHQPPHWKSLMYSTVVSVVVLLLGWVLFARLSRRFAEEV